MALRLGSWLVVFRCSFIRDADWSGTFYALDIFLNFHQNVQYHLLEQFSVRNKTGLLLVLLYFVLIGIEKSRHSLKQSDKKLNPITTWSPTFSRALCCWFGFSLSFYRLFRVFFFSSDLLWFCFYDTQSKSTLYVCTNQNWIGIQSVQ